jgi:hypothetical protein
VILERRKLAEVGLDVKADYRIAELMPFSLRWRELRPSLWMSLAVLLMQSTLGRGLHDIWEAHLPVWVLAVSTPSALPG